MVAINYVVVGLNFLARNLWYYIYTLYASLAAVDPPAAFRMVVAGHQTASDVV